MDGDQQNTNEITDPFLQRLTTLVDMVEQSKSPGYNDTGLIKVSIKIILVQIRHEEQLID